LGLEHFERNAKASFKIAGWAKTHPVVFALAFTVSRSAGASLRFVVPGMVFPHTTRR
jgi:hypothetical protein